MIFFQAFLSQMGFLKVVAVSWVFGWKDTVTRVGFKSAAIFTFGYAGAVFLALVLSASLWHPISNTIYLAISVPAGVALFIITTFWAFTQRSDRHMGFAKWQSQVAFAGTEIIRHAVSPVHFVGVGLGISLKNGCGRVGIEINDGSWS